MNLSTNYKTIISVQFLLLLSLLSSNVYSDTVTTDSTVVDPSSYQHAAHSFLAFYKTLSITLHSIVENNQLNEFTFTLWKFFAVIQIIWLMVQYSSRGISFNDIFNFAIMCLLTRTLMLQYDTLTSALWAWSQGFADGLQKAFTHEDGNIFWLSQYIWKTTHSIGFISGSWLNPGKVIAIIITSIIVSILSIMGTLATVWGLWGYAIAKMIGFMFIPFLMFENLSWLFDGWCRFFFGFLFYNVIARANLILVVIALQNYFNLPNNLQAEKHAMMFSLSGIYDAAGLLTFLVLGIFALFSTGQFVKAIVGGSVVRASGAMHDAARSMSSILDRVGRR